MRSGDVVAGCDEHFQGSTEQGLDLTQQVPRRGVGKCDVNGFARAFVLEDREAVLALD